MPHHHLLIVAARGMVYTCCVLSCTNTAASHLCGCRSKACNACSGRSAPQQCLLPCILRLSAQPLHPFSTPKPLLTCADAAVRNASTGAPPSHSAFFHTGAWDTALRGAPLAGNTAVQASCVCSGFVVQVTRCYDVGFVMTGVCHASHDLIASTLQQACSTNGIRLQYAAATLHDRRRISYVNSALYASCGRSPSRSLAVSTGSTSARDEKPASR